MLDQIIDSSLSTHLKIPITLLVLVALEAVLSADNAVALAAIAQGLEGSKLQRDALNIGLVVAYVLRILLILTATWVIKYWQFELMGAVYLLWLVFNYFTSKTNESEKDEQSSPRHLKFSSLWQAIPMIAFTDLAFSLDSVTTSIAVADETWLILVGGTIGVITLRFLAGLFIRWLDEYVYLEDAGFITVGFVGLRLLLKVFDDRLAPPEWLMIAAIALLFIWGFSKRREITSSVEETSVVQETSKEKSMVD
jgi:YkoY family integral membrane protein